MPHTEPQKSSSAEHRSHERLQRYWEELRGGRPFPSEHEVSPGALGVVWRSCFLISIDDVTRRHGYRYSYLGQELVEAYGSDMQNPDIAGKLLFAPGSPMARRFDEVVKEHKPVMDEGHFVNLNKLHIRYRSCMLPLGTEKRGVTHILGCMRWKAY
jgi:hypothetical protein